MKISPEERKKIDIVLRGMMSASQRSLVSLRKNDLVQLEKDIEGLADSISSFIAETGAESLGSGPL